MKSDESFQMLARYTWLSSVQGQKFLPGTSWKYKFRCRPPAKGNLSRSTIKGKRSDPNDDEDANDDEGIVRHRCPVPEFHRNASPQHGTLRQHFEDFVVCSQAAESNRLIEQKSRPSLSLEEVGKAAKCTLVCLLPPSPPRPSPCF